MKRMLIRIITPVLCLVSTPSNAAHLNDFKDDYGIFFFEQSTCHYCANMIPKLDNIDAAYDIDILPVSLDGIPVPNSGQWASKTIPDNGRLTDIMPVDVTPTFYVINKATNQAAKMGHGEISESQFMENLILALQAIQVIPKGQPLSLKPKGTQSISDQSENVTTNSKSYSSAPSPATQAQQGQIKSMADDLRDSLKKKYLPGQSTNRG